MLLGQLKMISSHQESTMGTATARWARLVAIGLAVLGAAARLDAQDSVQSDIVREEAELIDQEAFDFIILTADAGGDKVKVFPIPFPSRQLPSNTKPTDRLTVVLKRFPEREYEIQWRDIDNILLYERRIYDEAVERMRRKDFIGAFANLSYLMKNYPKMNQLNNLRQEFLLKSAADRFSKGDVAQTLSTLESLRDESPGYQESAVSTGISRAADRLVQNYQESGDLSSAKVILNRLEQKYGPRFPVVAQWKNRLESLARAKLDEAQALMKNKQYREARKAAVDMLGILPDFSEGKDLIDEINRIHPMVRVGVMQRSGELDPASLTNWPARRAGALVTKTVVQFTETGAEGGQYKFALGSFDLSEDRQQLHFTLDPGIDSSLNAYELAQTLANYAFVDHRLYDPSWAAIFQSVSVLSERRIVVQLKRPNVLPHALMQWKLLDADGESSLLPGAYQAGASSENENSFVVNGENRSGQPVEIVEVFYDDAKQAVNDLLRGEIDILDQLYPADAKRLAADRRLTIGAYALPTTHMLIPVSDDPYLANVKFRRSLLYATNRQGMLEGELLNSTDLNDGSLVSGPFPSGDGKSDLLAYAYDPNIVPTVYSPQLAKLLIVMAEDELEQEFSRKRKPVPNRKKFRIGCPDFEFARVAVQAMIQQWKNVEIEAEMVILPPGTTIDPELECDLVYVVTTMWEPATDIERLLGGNGIAATDNSFVINGLEKLRAARNWREVRNALQDLHQFVDYHLPILPLWQVTDRFAVSRYVSGVGKNPVSLYEDVDSWRVDLGFEKTAGLR